MFGTGTWSSSWDNREASWHESGVGPRRRTIEERHAARKKWSTYLRTFASIIRFRKPPAFPRPVRPDIYVVYYSVTTKVGGLPTDGRPRPRNKFDGHWRRIRAFTTVHSRLPPSGRPSLANRRAAEHWRAAENRVIAGSSRPEESWSLEDNARTRSLPTLGPDRCNAHRPSFSVLFMKTNEPIAKSFLHSRWILRPEFSTQTIDKWR